MQYILVKIVDAVNGIYKPHHSEKDKDLAFMLHTIGGPGLLDMCHRAIGFPETSTCYRLLKKCKKPIVTSIDTPLTKFAENIEIVPQNPKYGYMLEMDETFTDKKVRWNPRDNKVYGLCYEHGRTQDIEFNDYDHMEALADMVKNDLLHIPRETIVLAVSSNSEQCKAQVIAALPTCSKNETTYQANLIDNVATKFAEKNGAHS